jgi:hypothetical protein
MKKITKLFLVILSAASLSVSAIAGELSVTGGVTATMVQGNDDAIGGKGLGISNELDFTANGELDNGYTWKWQTQLDGATTVNDDTRLEFGTPYGALGLYISEGGLDSKLGYGIGAMGTGSDYKNTFTTATGNAIWGKNISSYNNVQYHTPADLLPLGIVAKVGYAPNLEDSQGASAKSSGGIESKATGDDAVQYKITAAPIAGLSIGGDYMNHSKPAVADGAYENESAALFAKYTKGPLSVGAAVSGYQPQRASGVQTTNYGAEMYGIQFAVNDALSISYSEEKFDKHTSKETDGVNNTVTAEIDVEMEVKHLQAAYVIGGATLGVAIADTDNDDFTVGQEAKVTTFSIGLAF